MFNIGDKIKFSNETKEKFQTWLNSPDNCGRVKFCEELKRFDKEMPDWYFDSSEFVKIGDCKIE